MLKYKLENGAWVCVSPLGTEPRIKFYFGVTESLLRESEGVLGDLKRGVMERVEKFGAES